MECASDSPIRVNDFSFWVEHTPNLTSVKARINLFPLRFVEPFLLKRDVTVEAQLANPEVLMHPFVMPKSLSAKLYSALIEWMNEPLHPERKMLSLILAVEISFQPCTWQANSQDSRGTFLILIQSP